MLLSYPDKIFTKHAIITKILGHLHSLIFFLEGGVGGGGARLFSIQNYPKNLDLFYKTDLDIWDGF